MTRSIPPRPTILLLALAALVPLGCGGGDASDSAADEAMEAPMDEAAETSEGMAEDQVSVTIVEPAADTVPGPDVRVVLATEGIEIAPVDEAREGTAHHHLFLDTELTPLDQVVPLDDPQIVHMGDGRTEHTFEGLEAGRHRVIALLADIRHVPLDPPVADTVVFIVGG